MLCTNILFVLQGNASSTVDIMRQMELAETVLQYAPDATPEQCLGCQFDILPVEFTNVVPWVCECCGLHICASCRYSEPQCINVKCGSLQKSQ